MNIDDTEFGKIEHTLAKDIAASEDDCVRRPLPQLSDRTAGILIGAGGYGKAIETADLAQVFQRVSAVHEEWREVRIVQRGRSFVAAHQLASGVTRSIGNAPLA